MYSFASLSIRLKGLGLQNKQTPAGHLMTECISELIRHCRDIWTQTADTISQTDTDCCHSHEDCTQPYVHRPTLVHTLSNCSGLSDGSVQALTVLNIAWILLERRIPTERCISKFKLLKKKIQLSLLTCCYAAADSGW